MDPERAGIEEFGLSHIVTQEFLEDQGPEAVNRIVRRQMSDAMAARIVESPLINMHERTSNIDHTQIYTAKVCIISRDRLNQLLAAERELRIRSHRNLV